MKRLLIVIILVSIAACTKPEPYPVYIEVSKPVYCPAEEPPIPAITGETVVDVINLREFAQILLIRLRLCIKQNEEATHVQD